MRMSSNPKHRSGALRVAGPLLLAALTVIAPCAGAQTLPEQPTALFVSSAPIGAEVMLDGTAVGRTPLLLTNVEPGEHRLELFKTGYLSAQRRVAVAPETAASVTADLEPSAYVAQFSSREVITPSGRYAREDATVNINAGTYTLSTVGAALKIEPVYPLEGARRAARILTPVLAAVTLIAAAEDLMAPRAFSFHPSPSTVASFAVTAGTAGFLIGLTRDRNRYLQRVAVVRYEGEMTAAEAERAYNTGEDALAAGNLVAAVENYTGILLRAPDSEHLPAALYKTARVYNVTGQSELALPLFGRLVDDYPVIDFYDTALMQMAGIHTATGDYPAARAAIGRMVFADPLFTRAEVAEYLLEIDAREAEAQQ